MKRIFRSAGLSGATAALVVCLGACSPAEESAAGFRLPEGDLDRGALTFTELQCNSCHQVDGLDLPFAGFEPAQPIVLGGRTLRVKTYGELVTSIINPSHKLTRKYPEEITSMNNESIMATARLNEVITVQQLIDLVAFLQPQYELEIPTMNPYHYQYNYQ